MNEFEVPALSVASGLLVTAESYLIDRFQPDVEVITLPKKAIAGGSIDWRVGEVTATSAHTKRWRGLRTPTKPRPHAAPKDHWVIDLRAKSPTNWAHFLNNHLPLVFGLADIAKLDLGEALAVLPKETPEYILKAAAFFGIDVLATDDVVTGHGLEVSVTPWIALRAIRANWVRLPKPQAAIDALMSENPTGLPRKVFLSRKDTRALSNQHEIETILSARGFQTVYPEALSPADQIRLFRGADEMVAIHGAGMAPLLYCAPGVGPRRLIEILPCGHMTDVFRVIAGQVGTDWIGVRGRIKPEYVRSAYRLGSPFKAYSLDTFEADPTSLERAFDILDDRQEV